MIRLPGLVLDAALSERRWFALSSIEARRALFCLELVIHATSASLALCAALLLHRDGALWSVALLTAVAVALECGLGLPIGQFLRIERTRDRARVAYLNLAKQETDRSDLWPDLAVAHALEMRDAATALIMISRWQGADFDDAKAELARRSRYLSEETVADPDEAAVQADRPIF
ncbi:hypothetical protein LA345_36500 (plasmid) [Burkholderia vietnamiensis]|uniref:Uncharacterized protein n=1 Tax=Burkholderia vietnamiensis (strain G4 / LMG 22486) TaxID=269482 RepID=A4JVS3_BURVG|nr:hypothetical protein Bcep1808_7501 [Burkholderia vietnamiensis G4]MCB4349313.1 hypothetical protein [Burkholderia vietnamiensis]